MASTRDDEWLKIVIENFDDPAGEVSFESLIGILSSFGNLVYLLHGAMVHEPDEPLPTNSGLRKEFSDSYLTTFKPPEKGSYSLSVRMQENTVLDTLGRELRVDPPSPSEVIQFIEKSVELVSKDKLEMFWEMFPESSNSKRIIQGMKRLRPIQGYRCRWKMLGKSNRTIFNSERDLNYDGSFEKVIAKSNRPQLHVAELTLVAPIEELNLREETFKAVHVDGIEINGSLSDVFHENE